jgi:Flp pilus assembly protein TadD
LDPGSNPAWRGLASALTNAGRTGEALEAWEKAVAADPKDAFSTYNLGVAYFNKGDKDRARRSFEAYLELRRDSLTADEKDRVQALIARCRGERPGGGER